ncbi:hypothetical protein E4O03_04805 [Treponema sp. OMZ 792]|uniref:hypothetical protein n=1 Tax=unclassified Treponema TaxID=2638727 RepID=UPI0020A2DB31|nr:MULTISPECIES: hypothetical protein [unclassified Treponema]UTC76030.1 hypothetical protein E4O03_04805 [Treponema sp. OMZ 792]UTC78099.1 hypothetical protein E4O04_08845 [Treponema sp. OMZ 799]UTC80032.1 hypothetical protein E4O07_04825 [Treponema sp. OMZ 798]
MKKYIFIFSIISLIFFNAYSEDVINERTENMLNEIRNRNGVDYFEAQAEDEELSQDETEKTEPEIPETAVTSENEDEEAEIEKPPKEPFLKNGRQAFAFGVEIKVGASNSYFKIMDLFKDSLEVDLVDMSNKLPKTGFGVSAATAANIYLDIYIKSKAEFGFFIKADAYGFSNIPKNIIDFAAKGNLSSNSFNGKIMGSWQAFADTGIFYGMKFNSFKFRVSTSYFIPAFYMESDMGDYEFINDPITGSIAARGKLKLNMYSHIPIFGNPNSKFDLGDILSRGGVDFNFYGTYTFNELANLNFNVINIPIFPARLNKGISKIYEGDFRIESLIQYMNNFITPDQAAQIKPPSGSFNETNLAYNLPQKKIFRPLKLAVSSDIRPFLNDYLIITPSLGCHCYKPFYVDAGLKLESRFLKVLGAYIGMSYEDRVWKNTGGLFLETRIFRLETAVSAASPSFTGSFKGTGAEATIKMVFGY